ncbi:hypothetical protein HMH01_06695 [Halovulum dunhuangense]|uniref:Uncharacterized protein n=1 Tax=Halovulum dunhuangense TaxID=1505036 RepID=A0A849L1I2_9RHOB|nr:DUF6544 family protein [Halovulum dunhuangense]NNU80123.1 hypothetical protein [Halovulum dunhuangense]
MEVVAVILACLSGAAVALGLLRRSDGRAEQAERARLVATQPRDPARFSPDMLVPLPEPARRFFGFAIRPGTPLLTVADISMTGRFGMGGKAKPAYRQMRARQVLAAPDGFVWAMATQGGLPLSGSDTGRWTRFRILGLIPVARRGGDADHARAAFGRMIAEAVFWTPAALLPGPGVTWEAVDDDTARVTVSRGGLSQAVDVRVDAEGRPLMVWFQRWSDANPERRYRLQPFGGYLSDFREVAGFRLPHRVEAGNMFGTEDWFPFFLAEVTAIAFPEGGAP